MSPVNQNKRPRALSFLLHAHLPYGFSPGRQISLEQSWLYEAVTDCYLPLLSMLDRLPQRNHPWLTLSLSPTLLELWGHPEFRQSYRRHLKKGRGIIESEAGNPHHPLERRRLALEILKQWQAAGEQFDQINGYLAAAFTAQAKASKIELITTAATHAFLPAFQNDGRLRTLQIQNGIATFEGHTGIRPKGFWLPECAYYPGLEEDLAPHGIEYFCLEERGLTDAEPTASFRQPMACPNDTLALSRDNRISQKVWSARSGYPGHPDYREFHRDGIHDVDTDTCGEFALPDGGRLPFGLKYWRVTGGPEKQWYDPARAVEQAELDAADFIRAIQSVENGLTLLPFDAELFGHWWHEGPLWLERVLVRAAEMEGVSVQSVHRSTESFADAPTGQPAASTWGRKGDYSFWINRDTDWIYPLLNQCSQELSQLVGQYGQQKEALVERALRQAGRELLLASASDWPFMLRAGTTTSYAMERLRKHVEQFQRISRSLSESRLEATQLEEWERINPAFPDISLESHHSKS